MCNACGFYCCAWDGFGKCGCEHCPEPACWDDEEDETGDDDYLDFAPLPATTRPRAPAAIRRAKEGT